MSHQSITTIVLTGGPCAGKSSSLSYIAERLTEHGYHVAIIEEIATELQNKGFIPAKTIHPIDFQEKLLREALKRETYLHKKLRELSHKKCVILCDRGITDSCAYLSAQEWSEVLRKNNLTLSSALNRYDLVLHLRSVAVDRPELYTTSNNEIRRESVEEAVMTDMNTLHAWLGHESLRIIENKGTFDDKKASILKEILHFLGHPTPLEIEAKYLVSSSFSPAFIPVRYTEAEITQHYLGKHTRIRERKTRGGVTYVYTTKQSTNIPRVTIETEKSITKRKFFELLAQNKENVRTIKKRRYYFVYKNRYFELDVFEDVPLMLLEIETSSVEDLSYIELPPWIPIEKEVSTDENYYNSTLAKHSFK